MAKIVDYGFSRFLADKKSVLICGTPSYMAPELIKLKLTEENNRTGCYPMPIDIWALGVLMYFAHTKKFPFKATGDTDLLAQISKDSIDYSQVRDS